MSEIKLDQNEILKNPQSLIDNWSNIMTGLNQKYDKSKYTTFTGYDILDDSTLSEIYIGDGFGKRIIECPADDMTREWIKIENDTDCIIENELERLDAEFNINLALKWRAGFGGSINVIGINDGGKLQEPIRNKIKSIDWIRTYNRTDCYITDFHFNLDVESKNYGDLEFITIQPKYSAPFNVHVDRMLIWKGLIVPQRYENGLFYYWGMSEIQPIWTQLKNLGSGMDHIVKILYEFIIGKYKIDGLGQLIAENKRTQIEEIVSIIETAKSTIQGVMLDAKDDYQRDSANVAGLSDLLDRFMMLLAGSCGIPVSRLFGRSAAGMNATGEGDESVYYDMIRSKQKNIMKKNLLKLVNYINLSLGEKVKEPSIIFNSLFQQSQKEELECKKIQADIDNIYITAGVLTPDEVAENRFGGEGFSYDTKIEMMNRENSTMMENEELKSQLEEMKNNQQLQNQNTENNNQEE